MAFWWAAGCAYTLRLASQPMPATVILPDDSAVATPAVVRLRWAPYGHQVVTVTADDHRPLVVDLRDREIRFWRLVGTTLRNPILLEGEPRSEVRFVLVPEHGPSGTWTGDDLP